MNRPVTRLIGIVLLLIGVLVMATVAVIKTRAIPGDAAYVGSERCQACHGDIHEGWHRSLHPAMMRPVSEPGVVVADFAKDTENLLFDPSEAVLAIGSKWEQQFMGRKDGQETLLPGAWLVDQGRWKPTGWDGWQVPIPLKRCHGCHTVGLDVTTGSFVEPGVGCESCHGPGGWHVDTLGIGRIQSSLDAQVCGQCHTRGRSTDGSHYFPLGYRPGASLQDTFKESTPHPGQNTSHWWGNGRERKRHQEYAAWRRGGHADSLKRLIKGYDGRYGEVTGECLGCHSAEGALSAGGAGLNLEQVRYGITCAVCHNSHGTLDALRVPCSKCHTSGAFYHQPEKNAGHSPCPVTAEVGCIDCHMPVTVKNGGRLSLHSHAPGVIPPRDRERYGVPSSCDNGSCHADTELATLQRQFEAHYCASSPGQGGSGASREACGN